MKNYLNEVQPKLPTDNYTKPQTQAMELGVNAVQPTATPATPKPTLINPNVKDSGAPVAFTPRAAQMVNGVFGTPMDQSYDRAMGPINTTQGQSM